MLALVFAFFRFTRVGLAMRAAAANPDSARLVGISVGWMLALGWGLAASIGAVGGIPGRTHRLSGAEHDGRRAALRLRRGSAGRRLQPRRRGAGRARGGVLENWVGQYVPGGSELKLTFALVLIVGVLVFKPAGLFGRVVVRRV